MDFEESTKAVNESIARLANATAILVDNQVHLQENIARLSAISERQGLRIERLDDAFDKRMTRISERLDKLSENVFRHVTASQEHGPLPN